MKITKLALIIFFMSSLALSAQKITTDNLITYLFQRTATLNSNLMLHGWELKGIEKGDKDHYTISTWTTTAPSVYFQLYESPEDLMENYTVYQILDKQRFLNIKKEILSLGFKAMTSKTKANEIQEPFANTEKNIILLFRTAIIQNTTVYVIQTYNLKSKIAGSILFFEK